MSSLLYSKKGLLLVFYVHACAVEDWLTASVPPA